MYGFRDREEAERHCEVANRNDRGRLHRVEQYGGYPDTWAIRMRPNHIPEPVTWGVYCYSMPYGEKNGEPMTRADGFVWYGV